MSQARLQLIEADACDDLVAREEQEIDELITGDCDCMVRFANILKRHQDAPHGWQDRFDTILRAHLSHSHMDVRNIAFMMLCDLYKGLSRKVARSFFGDDEAMIEDVLQETYRKALEHLDQYKGKDAFRYWFIQILRHNCIDIKHIELRTDDVCANLAQSPDRRSVKPPEAEVDEKDLLLRIFEALSERERDLLRAWREEGLSYLQLADRFNIRSESSRDPTRVTAARRECKRVMRKARAVASRAGGGEYL